MISTEDDFARAAAGKKGIPAFQYKGSGPQASQQGFPGPYSYTLAQRRAGEGDFTGAYGKLHGRRQV